MEGLLDGVFLCEVFGGGDGTDGFEPHVVVVSHAFVEEAEVDGFGAF